MKLLIPTLALMMTFNSIAKADLSREEIRDIKKLGQLMAGKTLKCTPSDHHKVRDPKYRGDEGYFNLAIKGNDVVVSNNGGSGYGYANGEFRDIGFADKRVYLSAGDDGFQTLVFDFNRVGASSEFPDSCAPAVLLDASNFDYEAKASMDLVCCLK